MPINLYWDYKDWYASNISLWRKRLQWYGIKPNDKRVMFTLNSFGIITRDQIFHINATQNIMEINISLITEDSSFSKIEKLLSEYCPRWLLIQPFVLNKIIQSYQKNQTSPPTSICYIETIGEHLPSDIRRKARALFHCNVASMYGSEETNAIALENPKQTITVFEDNVFLEIEKENIINQQNASGNIIVTSLHNYAMPLIRYCLNDLVELHHGYSGKYNKGKIDCIYGRVNQAIVINNYFISEFFLVEIIAEANNRFGDPIEEYNFRFFSKSNLLLCYICLSDMKRYNYEAIRLFVEELFNKKTVLSSCINFSVIQCNEIPQAKEKKQILFIE